MSARLRASVVAWVVARLVASVVAGLVLLAWMPRAHAAPGFAERCEQALPKDDVDGLVEEMRAVALGGDDGCELRRVDTSLFQTRIEWAKAGAVYEILVGPRGCVIEPSFEGPDLAFYAGPEVAEACPRALAAVHEFVAPTRETLVPVVRGQAPAQVDDGDPWAGVTPLVLAMIAWLAALILVSVGVRARLRSAREAKVQGIEATDESGSGLGLGLGLGLVFGVALVARFEVVASLGNWYGPFLPAAGLGELRFGASAAVLQGLVRACSPWTVEVAFGLNRVIGALAAPLVMLAVRRLGGTLAASVVAGLVLALAPIPVRLSASSSEHVLAGTLALAAWVVWLRTPTDPSPVPRVLAICLALLAVLSRVDCFPQLLAIPLWTLLAGPDRAAQLGRRFGDAVLFGLAWAAIGVYAWFSIVVPSNHPGPDPEGLRYTAEVLFTQLGTVVAEPPRWISPLTLVLAILGVGVALATRKFGLVVAALLSWALIFIPLGRNLTHDGLTGARYFVLALPLLAILAAQAGDAATALVERVGLEPRARIAASVVGVGLLLGLGIGTARPAWDHTYTFQAEYLFLAEELDGQDFDDCTLWFVRPRQPTGEPDLDCCLAPDRSPLTLIQPGMPFRAMPNDRPPADEEGCHLYYYGSLCSIDPALAPRVPEGVARIHSQCEALRNRPGLEELGRQEVTDTNLNQRFRGPPLVELWIRRSD